MTKLKEEEGKDGKEEDEEEEKEESEEKYIYTAITWVSGHLPSTVPKTAKTYSLK